MELPPDFDVPGRRELGERSELVAGYFDQAHFAHGLKCTPTDRVQRG